MMHKKFIMGMMLLAGVALNVQAMPGSSGVSRYMQPSSVNRVSAPITQQCSAAFNASDAHTVSKCNLISVRPVPSSKSTCIVKVKCPSWPAALDNPPKTPAFLRSLVQCDDEMGTLSPKGDC